MTWLSELLSFPKEVLYLLIGATFLAGMIRGFAGFALSAVVMAIMTSFIAPVELIPMLWFLEMSASLILMRGGWQDADRSTAMALIVGAALGLPLGLILTLSIPVATSKLVALFLIIFLALTQLAKVKLPALATRPGTFGSGFGAGIVTGLSSLGGMFIALYALVRQLPPRTMRGTLNIYMMGAGCTGLITHLILGTINQTAASRGAVFILPCLIGVFIGKAFFTQKYEKFYKPVCLILLIGLAAASLIRLFLTRAL